MSNRFEFKAIVRGHLKLIAEQQQTEVEPLIYLDNIVVISDDLIRVQIPHLEMAIREQFPCFTHIDIEDIKENFYKKHSPSDNMVWIEPEAILQATGWKDKQGTTIFEGDACLIKHKDIGVVRWDCKKLKFIIGYLDKYSDLADHKSEELEVVDNMVCYINKFTTRCFKQ